MRNRRLIAALGFVGLMGLAAIALPLDRLSLALALDARSAHRTAAAVRPRAAERDLAAAGLALGDAVHIRIFKAEMRLEVWLRAQGERFAHFRDYEICTFSGELGPKLAEGDQQAPEGFYRVGASQLNPDSRHHLAFNLGFPNRTTGSSAAPARR